MGSKGNLDLSPDNYDIRELMAMLENAKNLLFPFDKHGRPTITYSFFLRFLNDKDPLFRNADGYFRYFLQKDISMMISTISIAEYCVGGDVHELPLKNLRIVPFNLDHAKRTGEFARIIFQNKNRLQLRERNIIPNDTKLFAQADAEEGIKIYDLLKQETSPKFQFIDPNTPHADIFGMLNL